MYTNAALRDTKLTEVKQIAANFGITTVEDKRCKHLWVKAILAAQGGEPKETNSVARFLVLIRGWFDSCRWSSTTLLEADRFFVLELYEKCRRHYVELCGNRFDNENFDAAFYLIAGELCPNAFSTPVPNFFFTTPQPPVTSPELLEPDDDEDEDLGETENYAEDKDYDVDPPEIEALFFDDSFEMFDYQGWAIYSDGDITYYQDPKSQEWHDWDYQGDIIEAIKELERHIDRIEFDRFISPGQLELPLWDEQIANDIYEIGDPLVDYLRMACRDIRPIETATERGAIDPTSDRLELSSDRLPVALLAHDWRVDLIATERSAIGLTSLLDATEPHLTLSASNILTRPPPGRGIHSLIESYGGFRCDS